MRAIAYARKSVIAKEELINNIIINICLKEAVANIKVKDYAITILRLESFGKRGVLSGYYSK
jgi:hypothetical protein